eukprot:1117874-Lingulodinium_polyedra.AAC.1
MKQRVRGCGGVKLETTGLRKIMIMMAMAMVMIIAMLMAQLQYTSSFANMVMLCCANSGADGADGAGADGTHGARGVDGADGAHAHAGGS